MSDPKVQEQYNEIEKKKEDNNTKIKDIRSTVEKIIYDFKTLTDDLKFYDFNNEPALPDNYKKAAKYIKKIEQDIKEVIANIENRIIEIDEIEEKMKEDIDVEKLNEYEDQLNTIESSFINEWKKRYIEISKQIREFKTKLETIQKTDVSTIGLQPLVLNTPQKSQKNIDAVHKFVENIKREKTEVYKNKDKHESIEISLKISLNQKDASMKNENWVNYSKNHIFKYNKDDYIIFKSTNDIKFTIGKIDLIYIQNNNNPCLYIKSIEPTISLLNPWILYWLNLAEKVEVDIFINKYELIDINASTHTFFPLVLFCDITKSIKTNLDTMYNIDDNLILNLNIGNKQKSDIVEIKTYFIDDSLPFYGIDNNVIKTHILKYMEISNSFNDFLNDNHVNESEKIRLKHDININNNTIANITISNKIFDLQRQYSELMNDMPIKLTVKQKVVSRTKPQNNKNKSNSR